MKDSKRTVAPQSLRSENTKRSICFYCVYYESRKRKLKSKLNYESIKHLKIKTSRFIGEKRALPKRERQMITTDQLHLQINMISHQRMTWNPCLLGALLVTLMCRSEAACMTYPNLEKACVLDLKTPTARGSLLPGPLSVSLSPPSIHQVPTR